MDSWILQQVKGESSWPPEGAVRWLNILVCLYEGTKESPMAESVLRDNFIFTDTHRIGQPPTKGKFCLVTGDAVLYGRHKYNEDGYRVLTSSMVKYSANYEDRDEEAEWKLNSDAAEALQWLLK